MYASYNNNIGSNFFGDDIRSRLSIRNQNQFDTAPDYQETYLVNDSIVDPYVMDAPQPPREQILVRMNEDDPYYQVMNTNPNEPNLYVFGDMDVIYNTKVPGSTCASTTPPGLSSQALETNIKPTPINSGEYPTFIPQGNQSVDSQNINVTNYSKGFEDISNSQYPHDYYDENTRQYPSITPGFIRAIEHTITPIPIWETTTPTINANISNTTFPIELNTTTPFATTTRPYSNKITTTPIIMNTPGITTAPSSKKHASFVPWVSTTTPSVSSYNIDSIRGEVTPTAEPAAVTKADVESAKAAAIAAAALPIPEVLSNPFYSRIVSSKITSPVKTGDSKLIMEVPKDTKLGMYAVVGRGTNRETKRIIGYGSLILNTPIDNDYPINTTVEIYAAKPGTDAAKEDAKITAILEKYRVISVPGIDYIANTGIVDCKITGWDDWTTCGADGKRTRAQLSIGPLNGGETCPPLKTETDLSGCSDKKSNEPCKIIGWSDWTPCHTGSTKRTRVQITNNGTGKCPELKTETDNSTCVASCQYTGWTNWSTCVNGKRTRTQTTLGSNCKPQTETDYSGCPINSTVIGWSQWSSCVAGSASRIRTEITIPPKNGGWTIEPKIETDNSTCPVACNYKLDINPRSPFYSCDKATATRVYSVAEFQPAINNGAPCTYEGVTIDSSSELVPSIDKCPIDSVVTGWSDWTQCNAGSSLRTRYQVTRPPVNNGNTIEPIIQSDMKTCPVDCNFTLDFSNNVVCDQNTGKNKYKVKTFNAKVNGGADCSYNGTIITQLNQIVPSNIDCSVNCIASYTDGNDFCDPSYNYVRTYDINKISINEGNVCAFSDPSYNVLIRDVSAIGTYNASVDTCTDCSFTLTQVGCDFSTARKMFSVATYKPAVRKGRPCTYTDGTLITGVGQKFRDASGNMQTYFVSNLTSDNCPVDCSYGNVSIVTYQNPSACSFVTYKLPNYNAAKNTDLGAKCRYNGIDICVNFVSDIPSGTINAPSGSTSSGSYQTNIGEPCNIAILRDPNLKYRYRFLTTDVSNYTIYNWASGVASEVGSAQLNIPNVLPLTQTTTYRPYFAGNNAASTTDQCYAIDFTKKTYDLSGGFTVAFWFYPLSTNTQEDQWLFSILFNSHTTTGLQQLSGLCSNGVTNSYIQLYDGSNKTTPFRIPLNKWSHITYIMNKTSIKVYINGFLVTTNTSNVLIADQLTNTNFYIGHYNNMKSGYHQEFLYYNRPLTDIEIRNIVSFT